MTVIAAAYNKKSLLIGSDSLGSSASTGECFDFGGKLITNEDGSIVVGFADSYRTGMIIGDCLGTVKGTIESLTDVYQLVEYIREQMFADGCEKTGSGGNAPAHSIEILMATQIGLFLVNQDYQIHEINTTPFASIGVGSPIALGAMTMGFAIDKDPDLPLLIEYTIKAAIEFNCYCGGMVSIAEVELKR